jgi:subtilase family serine protease
MNGIIYILVALCCAICCVDVVRGVSVLERDSHLYGHIRRRSVAPSQAVHKIVFAVKQQNRKTLERLFNDVSDPTSSSYKQFRSRRQLAELFADTESTDEVVAFLSECACVQSLSVSKYGDFVTVFASVEQLNALLNTQFHVYDVTSSEQSGGKQSNIIRAEEYKIPEALSVYVDAVFNVDQFPGPSHQLSHVEPIVQDADAARVLLPVYEPIYGDDEYTHHMSGSPEAASLPVYEPIEGDDAYTRDADPSNVISPIGLGAASTYITPPFLYSHYNIFANDSITDTGSQAVYATIEQSYSPSDLASFQATYGLPSHPVDKVWPSVGQQYVSNSACSSNVNNCVEGNLDVQYLMGISPYTPTTWSYDDSGDYFLLNWLTNVSSLDSPPLVITISYGLLEVYLTTAYVQAFDTVAMLLGLQGVTIVAASGDDGAAGYNARIASKYCGYFPMWPASSPYVMSLGGTMLTQSGTGTTETACMATGGGKITTGGGFSILYTQPLWQVDTVNQYFDVVSTQPAASGSATSTNRYNVNGRAYPDLSLLGYNYRVILGGKWYSISGTSASAPVFAGMECISLLCK